MKMSELQVKIVNKSDNSLPEYSTLFSAGMDLRAFIENELIIMPGERMLVPTGLYIELPEGYEAQIRPRSGLAIKRGIGILNSPGTIDSDYRGEIGIIIINCSKAEFIIKNGDRIAQMVITKYEKVKWLEVKDISPSARGIGGFGHTGKA